MRKLKLAAVAFAAAFALGAVIVAFTPQETWAVETCDYYWGGGYACYEILPVSCSCGEGFIPETGSIAWCCNGLKYDENGALTIPCDCSWRCTNCTRIRPGSKVDPYQEP